MTNAIGYAAHEAESPLRPFAFDRRELRPDDVRIAIDYCGVCHSDLHAVRNDWQRTEYPVVPGHEIVGHVTAVGARVERFKVGDAVAVGCLVDSCQDCGECHAGVEQFCRNGSTGTYGGKDRITGERTHGGYSDQIVVREHFVLRVPGALDLSRTAPLLCAGITMYSPLRTWKVQPGDKVAIVGLGGLGHMGVKLANALGAEVTVITTSASKAEDARKLGAQHVAISTNPREMKALNGKFRLVIDTIPMGHDVAPYLRLTKRDGTVVLVGAIDMLPSFHSNYVLGRRSLSGSAIGGIAETQELLDFCAKHEILPECEMIPMQQINSAYERMLKNDVKYRFVIDMKSLGGMSSR